MSRESVSISEMREGDREKSPTLLFSDRRGDEERTEAREIKIADRRVLERRNFTHYQLVLHAQLAPPLESRHTPHWRGRKSAPPSCTAMSSAAARARAGSRGTPGVLAVTLMLCSACSSGVALNSLVFEEI